MALSPEKRDPVSRTREISFPSDEKMGGTGAIFKKSFYICKQREGGGDPA